MSRFDRIECSLDIEEFDLLPKSVCAIVGRSNLKKLRLV